MSEGDAKRQRSDIWGPGTRWSMVRGAGRDEDRARQEESWRFLIERYREAVAASVRRQVSDKRFADEMAEGFFAYAYEHKVLEKADASRGRFRCYLQGVIRRYVLHGLRTRGLPAPDIDAVDPGVAATASPAEIEEERNWATAVLGHSLRKLRRRNERNGVVLMRFYGIAPFQKSDVETIAGELGLKPNAVHQLLNRARNELRDLIESELMNTVDTVDALEGEFEMVEKRLLEAFPDNIMREFRD